MFKRFKQRLYLIFIADEPAQKKFKRIQASTSLRRCREEGDGNFCIVPHFRLFSQTSDVDDDIILYIRDPVKQLMEEYDRGAFFVVAGSPGIGKSTTTWMWLCRYVTASKDPISVLWVKVSSFTTILFLDNTVSTLSEEFCEATVELYSPIIVIFDGVTVESTSNVFKHALRLRLKKIKVILVTSAQIKVNKEDLKLQGGKETIFQPWTFDEYLAACKFDPFFSKVTFYLGGDSTRFYTNEERAELIREKIIVSGFSARWTFKETEECVINSVREYIDRIQDMDAIVMGL
jgi:hypothetical protein